MPNVSIFMAVYNGAPWLADVLDSVAAQTYADIEVTIWDNGSTDDTAAIAHRYPGVRFVPHDTNTGFWGAMEQLIDASNTPYVICLTDVVLHPKFVEESITAMERDDRIGAVQGKIFEHHRGADGGWQRTDLIDAIGFRLERSRRVTILGHGERDEGQYDRQMDVFGVEGAVPVFRRTALQAIRVDGCIMDPDYRVGGITYADDFDLGWRMTLLGWRQVMVPTAIGWHDRSTTKGTAHRITDHVGRLAQRQRIALSKRRLDWSNIRFTIIKNDHILNILRDLPWFLAREVAVQGYMLLFEPRALAEWGRFLRLAPRMFKKRRAILSRAKLTAAQMHRFIG